MIESYLGIRPHYDTSAFVADNATVIGDVRLGSQTSIWYNAVVRGDVNWIRIGDQSNVQDNAVVHVTHGSAPTLIGNLVTIGHSAVVHGCTIEDACLIGIGAVVLDNAVIGQGSLVGARALVTGNTRIPPRSLVVGSPARVVRELSDEEVASVRQNALNYVRYRGIVLGEETPEFNPFYTPRGD
jgi:gamma-carbonic anhydrase